MTPKITLVTPNFNQANFLERTILSVLNQGYPNLEYIIIDGGSTDGSLDIIKKYASQLAYWVSEPDNGLYDAINKGFAHSTGEIMGWLNSDDILFDGSLKSVAQIFTEFAEVSWINGIPISIDEDDRIIGVAQPGPWSRNRILSGTFQWIPQESTFWRRPVWQQSGATLDTTVSLAGDFELWMRFSRKFDFYSVKLGLAGFRVRSENQKSLEGHEQYKTQAREIIKRELRLTTIQNRMPVYLIKVFRFLLQHFSFIGLSRLYITMLNNLLRVPPTIAMDRSTARLVKLKRNLY